MQILRLLIHFWCVFLSSTEGYGDSESLTEPTYTPQTTGGQIPIVTYRTRTKLFTCPVTHSSFKVN